MPVFGEYETVGEPIAVTEERAHTSTVWQARKTGGGDARLYAVKCYLARPQKAKAVDPSAEEPLDDDPHREFVEGIKQLKRAQSEGGRCLTPVHAFGIHHEEGAWYVTDFFPGKSLKEWITRRGRVDSAGLRHVVHSAALGCLALKRARGYSHGNVKASNVFLLGKPRPLRQRPLVLADPYPAAPLQVAGLEGADRAEALEMLGFTMQAHDLRSIGELILQLVEGRLLQSSYDYNFPIGRTSAWDAMGKAGEFWREVCNRLLDPKMSPEKESLEKLEAEFRPSAVEKAMPTILAFGGAACVVVIILMGTQWVIRHSREADLKQALAEAETLLDKEKFEEALKVSDRGIKLATVLNDPARKAAAMTNRQQAELGLTKNYKAAIESGDRLVEQTNFTDAGPQFEMAEKLSKPLPDAGLTEQAAKRSRVLKGLAAARSALDEADLGKSQFEEAERRAGEAVDVWPVESAMGLRRRAQAGKGALESFQTKLDDGKSMVRSEHYRDAKMPFDAAGSYARQANSLKLQREAEAWAAHADLLNEASKARDSQPREVQQKQLEVSKLEQALKKLETPEARKWYDTATNQLAFMMRPPTNVVVAPPPPIIPTPTVPKLTADDLLKDALTALKEHRYDSASNNFARILEMSPQNVEATNGRDFLRRLLEGKQALEKKNLTNAAAAFWLVITNRFSDKDLTNDLTKCLLELADGHLVARNFLASSNDFYQARRFSPADPKGTNGLVFATMVIRGDESYRKGDFENAWKDYSSATNISNFREYASDRVKMIMDRKEGSSSLNEAKPEVYEAAISRLEKGAGLEGDLHVEPLDQTRGLAYLVERVKVTNDLVQAKVLLRNGEFLGAFLQASNAFQKAKKLPEGTGREAATDLAGRIATSACTASIKTNRLEATNWIARAELVGVPEPVISFLLKLLSPVKGATNAEPKPLIGQKNPVKGERAPKPKLYGIEDLDFIWVDGVGSNGGAYVGVHELSNQQYAKLCEKLGLQAVALGSQQIPVQFTLASLSRAKELVVALNATKGQPEIKGRFFFLSAKDYSLLAALAGVRMSSDYILPSETIEELKDAENLSHGLSARLAPISNPKASDKFQLQYIIGNSREWTEGDGAFGIACDATTAKDTPTLRQLTRQVRPSERIGLRLAFDGAP